MNYRFITGIRVSLKRNKQPFQYPPSNPLVMTLQPTLRPKAVNMIHPCSKLVKSCNNDHDFPFCFQMGGPYPFSLKYSSLPSYCYLALCNILFPCPDPKFLCMTAHCTELYNFPYGVAMLATHFPLYGFCVVKNVKWTIYE